MKSASLLPSAWQTGYAGTSSGVSAAHATRSNVVYFVAQLVASLIERTVRKNMIREGLKDLPILPEGRPSKQPSAAQILETFAQRSEHQLYEGSTKIKTFIEPLQNIENVVLRLLNLSQDIYLRQPPQ